jgi:hypothetical protein
MYVYSAIRWRRGATFSVAFLVVAATAVVAQAEPSVGRDFGVDSTESYLTLSIPNFSFSGNNTNITGQNRTNGAPISGVWTSGNTAFITGTISTTIYGDFSPGGITAVQFIGGGSTFLSAINSGNYRPNAAAFNGGTQPATYNNNSAAGADYGGTMHVLLGNAGLFSMANATVGLSAADPLPVTGDSFPINMAGSPLVTGLDTVGLSVQALNVPIAGMILPTVENQLIGLAGADLSSASATLVNVAHGDLTMTIPIVVPFSLPVGEGVFLNGTATGQLVARTDPEPSSILLALLGFASVVGLVRHKRRAPDN